MCCTVTILKRHLNYCKYLNSTTLNRYSTDASYIAGQLQPEEITSIYVRKPIPPFLAPVPAPAPAPDPDPAPAYSVVLPCQRCWPGGSSKRRLKVFRWENLFHPSWHLLLLLLLLLILILLLLLPIKWCCHVRDAGQEAPVRADCQYSNIQSDSTDLPDLLKWSDQICIIIVGVGFKIVFFDLT